MDTKTDAKMKNTIIKWGIICGASILLLFSVFLIGRFSQSENKPPEPIVTSTPTITHDEIVSSIRGISELSTLDYSYTNAAKYEDQKNLYGWNVPLTTKSFIIMYDGTMKLGVDMQKINISIIGQEIRIQMPDAVVLSHAIDESSIEFLEQSSSIFNKLELQDYATFATDQKQDMENKAKENGLFEEARKRSIQLIDSILGSIPLVREDYKVVFY